MVAAQGSKDTIPRASIQQLLTAVRFVASAGGKSTFDAVRLAILATAKRRAPLTRTTLWTVARDVLSELERLGLASVGTLPRKLSDIPRLRDTPCELTSTGRQLARLCEESTGKAFDLLLLRWVAEHPYFRRFIARLRQAPLYVPDVTNLGQLGLDSTKSRVLSSATTLVATSSDRLRAVGWTDAAINSYIEGIERRFAQQATALNAPGVDAKRLIDLVQDTIVIPSFLEAEGLPFDPVTFSQILLRAPEFLCGAWTASHPRFAGRVVFSTCDFDKDVTMDAGESPTEVVHHGLSYAEPLFVAALRKAYAQVAGTGAGYVNAYAIRAVVCVDLGLQFPVFSRCLETVTSDPAKAGVSVYTELPFEPPPQGEAYIEVGKRRVGILKIIGTTPEP